MTIDLTRSTARPEASSGTNTVNLGAAVSFVELDGSSAGDTIRGADGDEFLNGNQGNDSIQGRAGADTLVGADGRDRLTGGSGVDTFDGGPAPDNIQARDGVAEDVNCGGGNDTVNADAVDTLTNCET